MKRSIVLVVSVVVALLSGLVIAAMPAGAAPYCGITWGSLPKELSVGSTGEVVDVRAGRHECFDRLVLDVEGPLDGYFVRYVDEVTFDGSGQPVPLRGGARLAVIATAWVSMDGDLRFVPDSELVDVTGYSTFRQVAWAGSFEGHTTVGLGVRARLPFRVLLLDGPGTATRLVVDVAHQW